MRKLAGFADEFGQHSGALRRYLIGVALEIDPVFVRSDLRSLSHTLGLEPGCAKLVIRMLPHMGYRFNRSDEPAKLVRSGQALAAKGVRRQIEVRTRAAFGKHVWPHLFRDCAVTELVDCAPEETGIAPDLLGHADLETTQRYYVLAAGMTSHLRVQEVIAARRRAAASRVVDA